MHLDNNGGQWCAQSALWDEASRARLKNHCASRADRENLHCSARIRGEAQWLYRVRFIFMTNYSDAVATPTTRCDYYYYAIKRAFSWHVLKKRDAVRWMLKFGCKLLSGKRHPGACKAFQTAPLAVNAKKTDNFAGVYHFYTYSSDAQTNKRARGATNSAPKKQARSLCKQKHKDRRSRHAPGFC